MMIAFLAMKNQIGNIAIMLMMTVSVVEVMRIVMVARLMKKAK